MALVRLLIALSLAAGAWWLWPRLPDPMRAPWHIARLSLRDAPSSLSVPVAGVGPRQLADTWNAARSEGRRHQGIDIFARRGTAVVSATEGVVTRVGTNRLGGKVVWVLGPGRQMHYYAHLDGYADVAAGSHVMPGDVLGYVGNTGNAQGTPAHLHYGIYAPGGTINPYPLLTAGNRQPSSTSDPP